MLVGGREKRIIELTRGHLFKKTRENLNDFCTRSRTTTRLVKAPPKRLKKKRLDHKGKSTIRKSCVCAWGGTGDGKIKSKRRERIKGAFPERGMPGLREAGAACGLISWSMNSHDEKARRFGE